MSTQPIYLRTPKNPRPPSVLDNAAMSIVAAAGRVETLVDVLHGRALRHYTEGLHQYLAIRLGDVGRARSAMGELRALVATRPSEELVAAPGIRARLYGLARQTAQGALEQQPAPGATQRALLPWRAHPSSEFKPAVLRRIRVDLPPEDAELLELRYARELTAEEIAFVLGLEVDEILARLESASHRARSRARGTSRAKLNLRRLLLEAYALENLAETRDAKQSEEGWEPLGQGTAIGRRYQIQSRVGSGAFGDVYRATDTEVPGHVVALKLLHQPSLSEGARQVALRELRLIASVFHPSVVQFKDHGWYEGRLWFVMPWYEGETLSARLDRGPLGRDEALRVFQPLARALMAMHAAGVRHQDVKPDNIFLARIPGAEEDEVLPVLLDLGVAAKDAEMVVAGTPTYFAPEVAAQFASVEEKPQVTPKADVFALALALRNSLEPSTKEDIPGGAIEAFIERRARHVPALAQARELRYMQGAFRRWLSPDPDARPSAEELSDELRILVRPEERRSRRRRLVRWTAPVLVACASLVAVMYQNAQVKSLEAEQARMAEAVVRADLELSQEELIRLEADVRRNIEHARMTREELTSQLEQAEGLLLGARQRLHQREQEHQRSVAQLEELRGRIVAGRGELASVQRRLGTTEESLVESRRGAEAEGRRASEAEGRLRSNEGQLARARDQVSQLESQRTDLGVRVATLDSRLAAEAAKAERLESDIADAIGQRTRAEQEAARLRSSLRRLEAERSAAGSSAEPEADTVVPGLADTLVSPGES